MWELWWVTEEILLKYFREKWKNTDSPQLLLARLEIQKNVRCREETIELKCTYPRDLLSVLLRKKKKEGNRHNHSFFLQKSQLGRESSSPFAYLLSGKGTTLIPVSQVWTHKIALGFFYPFFLHIQISCQVMQNLALWSFLHVSPVFNSYYYQHPFRISGFLLKQLQKSAN